MKPVRSYDPDPDLEKADQERWRLWELRNSGCLEPGEYEDRLEAIERG